MSGPGDGTETVGPGHGRFGPYELLEHLGQGGMGEVRRARDTRRDREVALKLLAPQWSDDPEFRRRFLREARAIAVLDSPHVITINDHGEIDGRLYIDMPLIAGGDLAGVLAACDGGLDPGRAVDLAIQVAGALDTAHRAGLVHRDVKPHNVLLEPRTEDHAEHDHAYLVDFGVARIADETASEALTATGNTLGTPAYMAPELFTSATRATPASDIYALGCVLFEMLTGHRPFDAATTSALIGQHLYEPVPHPSDTEPALAPYDLVVSRALAKSPDQRYPDARTFTQALRYAQSHRPPRTETTPERERTESGTLDPSIPEPSASDSVEHAGGLRAPSAHDPSPPSRRRRPGPRRVRLAALLGLVVLVAGGVIAGLAWTRAHDADSGPDTTPTAATGPILARVPSRGGETVTFSPDSRRAYINQTDAHTMTVVDTRSGNQVADIPTPEGWGSTAISPDGSRAYVTGYRGMANPGNRLTVIDTATDAVIGTVPTGVNAQDAALSPDGRLLYTANFGTVAVPGSTVSVVDTATASPIGTIPVGISPTRVCPTDDGRTLYVPDEGLSDANTATVTAIDTGTGRTSDLRVGAASPVDCALSPDGRQLWVSALGPPSNNQGSVRVIDTVSGRTTEVDHGAFATPYDLAMTPDGGSVLVPDPGSDGAPRHSITVIDTATLAPTRSVALPCSPVEVSVRPDGREAWVSCAGPDSFWRIPLP